MQPDEVPSPKNYEKIKDETELPTDAINPINCEKIIDGNIPPADKIAASLCQIITNDTILPTDVIIPCVDPRFYAIRRRITNEFIIRRVRPLELDIQDNKFFGQSNIPLKLLDQINNFLHIPLTKNIPKFDLIPELEALRQALIDKTPADGEEEAYEAEFDLIYKLKAPKRAGIKKTPHLVGKDKTSKVKIIRPRRIPRPVPQPYIIIEPDVEELTEKDLMISREIKQIFGHNRFDPTPSFEECKDMVSTRDFIETEEKRAAKLAREEDRRERRLYKEDLAKERAERLKELVERKIHKKQQ